MAFFDYKSIFKAGDRATGKVVKADKGYEAQRATDSAVREASLSTRNQTMAAVHDASVSNGTASEAQLDPSQIIDSIKLSEIKDLETLTESIVASARQHGMINVDVIHISSGTTFVFMSTADGEETIAFDYDENVGAAWHGQHGVGKVSASGAASIRRTLKTVQFLR